MERVSGFEKLKHEFCERTALNFEQDGSSPLLGRIFSLLIFAPHPLGLQEMADKLGVTKAAVSIQIRRLEKTGVCHKRARGNDRKDFYSIDDSFSLTLIGSMFEKLTIESKYCKGVLKELEQCKDIEEDKESFAVFKRRMNELNALLEIFLKRLDGFEEEWRERREQLELEH